MISTLRYRRYDAPGAPQRVFSDPEKDRLLMKHLMRTLCLVVSVSALVAARPPQAKSFDSVTISATATVVTHDDRKRSYCSEHESNTTTTTVNVNVHSDKLLVTTGDDFSLDLTGATNDPAASSLQGGGSFTYKATSSSGSSCGHSASGQQAADAQVDLSNAHVMFIYDRKAKQGEFGLGFSPASITGSGTITTRDNSGSRTADVAELSKVQLEMQAAAFGQFQGSNHVPELPAGSPAQLAQMQILAQASLARLGLGGSNASIVETPSGFDVSYSNSATVPNTVPSDWEGTSTITITTNVHISIGGKPIDYDAILVPVGGAGFDGNYEKWIPEGPPPIYGPPAGPLQGNFIAFRIKLVDKAKPATEVTGVAYKVTYELYDSSHIPGYATNFPKTGGDEGSDLLFDEAMQHMPVTHFSGDRVISNDDEGAQVAAIIRSYDYAGYATLKAMVHLKTSDIDIQAHLQGETTPEVSLPYDKNHNHIADAWEEREGVLGENHPPKWDDEHVDGNAHDGDGLTMFEEYRGFACNRKHERLSPKNKDVFVINQTPMDLSGHFRLFESATEGQIKVHVCKADELDRIVNPTQTEGKGGDQYGIIVKTHDFGDPAVLAAMFPEPPKFHDPIIQSPREADYLGVSGNLGAGLDHALAHELAHGMGVRHHGESEDVYDQIWENNVLLKSTLVDVNGNGLDSKSATNNPDKWTWAIARDHSQASGDVDCIMTYNKLFTLIHKELSGQSFVVLIADIRARPNGTKFCRLPKGTQWNAADRKPFPVFGDAAKGDCWSQFLIKTW